MRRFLIATDGSPAAAAAVQAGVELAADQDAGVVFLRVEAPDVAAPLIGPVLVSTDLGDPAADEVLAAAAEVAHERFVPFELRLVAGAAADAILAMADEIDAVMVVVGSNRHGALATAFFGSVSQQVLRRSRRPVLVVHPTPALVAEPV